MQLRSSVANGAAYPTCLTTVYALTNILFVGFRKKKRSITQKERKERGKWGKILKFFLFLPYNLPQYFGTQGTLILIFHIFL